MEEQKIARFGKVKKDLESIVEKSYILGSFAKRGLEMGNELASDPMNMRAPLSTALREIMSHPDRIFKEKIKLSQKYFALMFYTAQRFMGFRPKPVIEVKPGDNRFRNEDWDKPFFDFLKQSYLLWSESALSLFDQTTSLDDYSKRRLNFYLKLYIDAWAPNNFIFTNPEVLRKSLTSGGENLIEGFLHFLEDLEKGKGNLLMRNNDHDAFKVGKELAITKGKVVYQNDLMQLLMYSPTTKTVKENPVLVIPAWINKFYILDLQQKNSYIKWVVDQGYTVFAISWVNPDAALAQKHFVNYMLEGPIEALTAIEKITGVTKVNLVGYCLGGTLTATTAAYLAEVGQHRVNSVTLLTTLTDFSEPGELGVFIDDAQVGQLQTKMRHRGYLEAWEMSAAFNMLRDNDLIWGQMVSNYLLGKKPMALDMLTWNADSTRLPAEMHTFYLRKMYVENVLVKPSGIFLNRIPINLSKIDVPTYQLSARDDHIAPWKSTYKATQIFTGKKRFVLSASGHIAGVVNPPVNNKYNYWTNDNLPANPDEWFASAKTNPGSWWVDWQSWVSSLSGNNVLAREPQSINGVGDAPGSYVYMK